MDLKERPIAVVLNPGSTQYGETAKWTVEPLVDAYGIDPAADIIETPSPKYREQVEAIASRLVPGMVVVCATGDGGANAAGNAIIESEVPDVQVLFVAGGNACDIACSINPGLRDRPDGVVDVLANGVPHPLSAIDVKANDDQRRAFAYYGKRFTYRIASLTGDPVRRLGRPSNAFLADVRDGVAMLGVAASNRRFEYWEDGQLHRAHDIFAFNVNTLAKVMKLGVNTLSDEVRITTMDWPWLLPEFIGRTLREAMRDGLCGELLDRREITIAGDRPVGVHYDGETDQFGPGTRVVISRQKEAITTIVHPSRLIMAA